MVLFEFVCCVNWGVVNWLDKYCVLRCWLCLICWVEILVFVYVVFCGKFVVVCYLIVVVFNFYVLNDIMKFWNGIKCWLINNINFNYMKIINWNIFNNFEDLLIYKFFFDGFFLELLILCFWKLLNLLGLVVFFLMVGFC